MHDESLRGDVLQFRPKRKGGTPLPKTHPKSKPFLTFKHSVDMQVYLPEFERLGSLKFLDYRRYEKGTHKVEVGFLAGGCSRRLVRAIVNKGMVTGFEVEPCKESRPATPAMNAILKKAYKLILAKTGKWQPIPVSEIAKVSAIEIFPPIGCFRVCEASAVFCYTCCFGLGGFHCTLGTNFPGGPIGRIQWY
jgi:hypothetical protein